MEVTQYCNRTVYFIGSVSPLSCITKYYVIDVGHSFLKEEQVVCGIAS